MNLEIKNDKGESLRFKKPISLEDFGTALDYFNRFYEIMSGNDATWNDFVSWLETQPDIVEIVKDGKR